MGKKPNLKVQLAVGAIGLRQQVYWYREALHLLARAQCAPAW